MSRNVERQAQDLVYTSVQDALSGAWGYSIAVLERAIQLERKREQPRVALISGLRTEIRRKQRETAGAPKDAA